MDRASAKPLLAVVLIVLVLAHLGFHYWHSPSSPAGPPSPAVPKGNYWLGQMDGLLAHVLNRGRRSERRCLFRRRFVVESV